MSQLPFRGGRGRARARTHRSSSPRTDHTSSSSDDGVLRQEEQETPRYPSISGKMAVLSVTPETAGGDRRGAQRGTMDFGRFSDYDLPTKPDNVGSKQGSKGNRCKMITNYFRLTRGPQWTLHEYHVFAEPEQNRMTVMKAMLRKNQESLGAYIFDGTKMYTAHIIDEAKLVFNVEMTEGLYKVVLRHVGVIEPGNPTYIQFYNIILRRCLFGMGLEEMGRHFYDHTAAINLQQHRLSLWPGYVTSLRQHEHDVLLCIETTHKVLRLDNVNELMRHIRGNSRGGDPEAEIQRQFKDTIVMTSYNRKTYHIKDIDFKASPLDSFETKKGKVSYVDYYKNNYDKEIKDMKQPMIRCEPSKKDKHRGFSGDVVLVPELCQLTGLTDTMRENFTLMKELSKHLHMGPQDRVKEINRFMDRLYLKDELVASLKNWGLEFERKLMPVEGRTMNSEKILFANNGEEPADNRGDWTKAFRSQKMLTAIDLSNWVIIVPQRDAGGVENLARTMTRVAGPLNMKIAAPAQVVSLVNVSGKSYNDAIVNVLDKHPNVQMLFVILPNNKPDTYGVVKKKLAVEKGVLSQCFVAKNVTSKGLMSIATKVVVQMNAKLGGEPWSVKLPLKNLMIVGFDVYHGAKGTGGKSVGAMVSTISPTFAKYFSTTSTFNKYGTGGVTAGGIATGTDSTGVTGQHDELAKAMTTDFIKCIRAYAAANGGTCPERIVIFRDGVGDGQLQYVYKTELTQLQEALRIEYEGNKKLPIPKFTFIVVTKKINTRIMTDRDGKYDNPAPGTVVDDVITLPDRYDFYLVSCTARQGTVSPCSFNVLYDSQGLDPDKMQMLTYKMCHMYFNWSGTVAVPAPCQYAHKLAFITGVSYGKAANANLQNLLHFL